MRIFTVVLASGILVWIGFAIGVLFWSVRALVLADRTIKRAPYPAGDASPISHVKRVD